MMRWKNLLSTGNEFIKLPLDKEDLTLIVGKNGAGKSQFLDAICFVLFKQAFRDINLPQLVNSINKKNMVVEIAFSKGSDQFVVRRGLKPAIFEIYKNNELIKEDSVSNDYQKFLEKEILEFNYKTFVQIAVVGKATYIPFMALKPQPRREFIEDLLDTHVYGKMAELAKAELKELNTDIATTKSVIMLTGNNISAQQRHERIRDANKEGDIAMKQEEIASHEEKISALDQSIREHEFKIKELITKEADVADYEKVIEAKSKIESEISKFQSLIDVAKRKLKGLDGEVCPSCKQKIDENHVAHIQKGVDEEVAGYVSQSEIFVQRNKKLHAILEELSALRATRAPIESNLQRLQNDRNREEALKERCEKDIEEIKNKKPAEDLFDINVLNAELSGLNKLYDDNNRKVDIVKKAIKYLGDDGIKAVLISKYIPIINTLVNKYLEAMDLFVQFELDEQFGETIKARYKDTYTYESFSEGEKLRINMALLLTWRQIAKLRNSVATNLMVYDEVLDGSFDAEGILDFMKILGEGESQNVFIISHNPDVKDLGFDNVIRAEKVGHFTEYNRV